MGCIKGVKGDNASITGAASSITTSDLTTSRALVSNASGKVAVSAITSAQLDCLSGVTSNVQTQIDAVKKTADAAARAANIANDTLVDMFDGALPDSVLANNSAETIQRAAILGVGPNFWSVGDKTAPIKLNGKVGALTFSNQSYYAFILGFNHNPGIEGGIHFQFGKTSNGTDIAFVDSGSDTDGFKMNLENGNAGGWESSYMRKTICPAFYNALPKEWRDVISSCTKYSDNTGNAKNTPECVTATQDKIWIASEFELYGAITNSNSAEQDYQQQYKYYANGNGWKKYKHSSTGTGCDWWTRSAVVKNTSAFRYVGTSGITYDGQPISSLGFAPCFKVG